MKDETEISKANKISEKKYSNASNGKGSEIINIDESKDIEKKKKMKSIN